MLRFRMTKTGATIAGWLSKLRPFRALVHMRSETTNRHFNDRFSAMIGNMKDGVIVSGPEGVTQWNRAALALFEINEEQILRNEPYPPGWNLTSENGIVLGAGELPTLQCLSDGVPISTVLGLQKPDGEMVWIQTEVSPVYAPKTDGRGQTDALPQVSAVVATYRNITEQRRTFERYELAMKSLKLGVWEWDVAADSITWDAAMSAMFGVEPALHRVNYYFFDSLIVLEDRDGVRSSLDQAISEHRDASFEFRIQRPDGAIRVIRAETKGFYSASGKVQRHVGVTWDVTEQREQELRVLQASKMSSLGEMSAGIAHEINNPLAIIIGKSEAMSSLLAQPTFEKTTLSRHIEVIERTAHRIAKIVRSLRTFARDGRQDPLIPTSVAEIVNETFALCHSRFLNSGIDLTLGPIDSRLLINARAVEISQVILNLLNNAFDACADLAEKWVRVDVKEDDGFVEISVTDSGAGIPPAIREKMLHPFFTTKEVGMGTGLGLSIASGIAQSHAGTLSIDAADPNTKIVIRIPRTKNQSSHSAA